MADLDRAQVILVINSGKNFRGVDLSGLNLSGLDLSKANLTNTNFSGADLTNVNFSGSDLTRAIFEDIKKDDESQFCKIEGCDFSNATLDGARFIQQQSETEYYKYKYADGNRSYYRTETDYIGWVILPNGSRGDIYELSKFGVHIERRTTSVRRVEIYDPPPPPPQKRRGLFG